MRIGDDVGVSREPLAKPAHKPGCPAGTHTGSFAQCGTQASWVGKGAGNDTSGRRRRRGTFRRGRQSACVNKDKKVRANSHLHETRVIKYLGADKTGSVTYKCCSTNSTPRALAGARRHHQARTRRRVNRTSLSTPASAASVSWPLPRRLNKKCGEAAPLKKLRAAARGLQGGREPPCIAAKG